MYEYIFQSRAMRILSYAEGAVISVFMLALIPCVLSNARSTPRFFEPPRFTSGRRPSAKVVWTSGRTGNKMLQVAPKSRYCTMP